MSPSPPGAGHEQGQAQTDVDANRVGAQRRTAGRGGAFAGKGVHGVLQRGRQRRKRRLDTVVLRWGEPY
jgi:hypothetical protein